MSWILIAHSAIEGGCGGILAAGQDVIDHIEEADGSQNLFVFPSSLDHVPGIYLWKGTLENAFAGEGGSWELVAPEHIYQYIQSNGEDL